MRISDWSSDVCSSDLVRNFRSDLSIAGESSLTLPALIAAMRDLPRDADAIAARRARLTEASARLRRDRKSVVSGKSVLVRVDLGGRRISKRNKAERGDAS